MQPATGLRDWLGGGHRSDARLTQVRRLACQTDESRSIEVGKADS